MQLQYFIQFNHFPSSSDQDPKWKKTYAYKKEKETNQEDEDEEVRKT